MIEPDEQQSRQMEALGRFLAADSTIEAARKEAGLSQRGLASLSGISQTQISRFEAGDLLLTGRAAEKLGVALKMAPAELVVRESLSALRRLAVKGKLDPEVTVEVALNVLESAPASEAAGRMRGAVLDALLEISRTAGETRRVATKAKKSASRTGLGVARRKVVDSGRD